MALAYETPERVINFHQAWFINLQSNKPPSNDEPGWRRVELLDNWYISHRQDDFPAWYRVDFDIEAASGMWSVYLPAVNSNAVVWLNEEHIGDGGRMHEPVARNWHRPLFFMVPGYLLKQGKNSLYVQLRPKNSGFGYLGTIHIGHESRLRPVYEKAYLYKQVFVGASAVLLLSFSIFISLLWIKRRQDSLYGWFAAASFSWMFFVFDMYVRHVPIQERLWDAMVFASVGWLVIFMTIFFHRFWNLYYPRLERIIILFGVTGTITLYLVGDSYFYFFSSYIWDNLLIMFSVYMTWFIINQCKKSPTTEAWMLGIALAVVVGFGGHDNLVQMGILPVDRMHLLPYGAPFLLGVVIWMLIQRFVAALEESEKLNLELDKRVQIKTSELEENYRHIKKIEEEKILAQERERIMRDMHDGTGGLLVAALAQVEKGSPDKAVLIATLQNALDEIRLMIDSLDPVDDDIVAVLAMFRSRMEARLHNSGIHIIWKIEDVPVLPGLNPEKILHLVHILYEAVTNTIKHADASAITFRTGVSSLNGPDKSIIIEIEDNGKGFNDTVKEGNGIANMYWRAAIIGARLELFNSSGAVLRISLPVL